MGRLPAGTRADAAAVLQGGEEGVAQEGLAVGQQGIPLRGGQFTDTLKGLDDHRHSLARPADEKKPRRRAGLEWGCCG
jgi:hypothetical protein